MFDALAIFIVFFVPLAVAVVGQWWIVNFLDTRLKDRSQ